MSAGGPVGTGIGIDTDIVIDVVYAGPDLDRVADLTGLTAETVITAHTSTPWRVEYCGFAPGFAYLTDGDPRLAVPRLDTPRPEVPCGAVGLAGEYSGIYPRASPGGWNLIGRTDAVLWDLERDPPALLRTGMTVRFRAVRERVDASGRGRREPAGKLQSVSAGAAPGSGAGRGEPAGGPGEPAGGPGAAPTAARGCSGAASASVPGSAAAGVAGQARDLPAGPAIAIISPGTLCLIEDLGRAGLTDMGVSPSGAADRGAAIRANRLVGNPDGAAVLEVLLGGAVLRPEQAVTVAVTGASVPLRLPVPREGGDAAEPAMDRAFSVPGGATLRLGRARHGLRAYVSVLGGIDVPPVLGSRSTDMLSGLGPPPVVAGTRLPIGPAASGVAGMLPDPGVGAMIPAVTETIGVATDLDAVPGPQRDWFDDEALALLQRRAWTVSPQSNRVGVRLQGAALRPTLDAEMRIQPLTRGAIQVPPSGEPIAFMSDFPVTGGYPVIAVLTAQSVDRLAQARPGAAVRIQLR